MRTKWRISWPNKDLNDLSTDVNRLVVSPQELPKERSGGCSSDALALPKAVPTFIGI
jgi:hypothetical protein